MSENNYIERLKEKIEAKAKEEVNIRPLSIGYFDLLFDEIKGDIQNIAKILSYPPVDEITLKTYYDVAKKEYLSVNPINIDPSNSLTREKFITWLSPERKKSMRWCYAERYFYYLENNGRSKKVVAETIQSSMEIMEKLGDPKSDSPFYTKGLVVGDIQSGKTGNFNAVINRAIDCGYELIIVLSGTMEDLRRQTQDRIEADVVGEGYHIDSATIGIKGVGNKERFGNNSAKNIKQVISVTSPKRDFNKTLADADFQLSHTNILICKKNVSVLRNLLIWLHDSLPKENKRHNIPFLILDDEADNASLNNSGAKGREYATKINGQIRALLDLFSKKTYLGYTATPFANVLQDRNDVPTVKWPERYKVNGEVRTKEFTQVNNVFPDDFIVLLNPPSNYVGAKQIFETIEPIDNKVKEKIPLYEVIDDNIECFPTRLHLNNDNEIIGVKNFMSKKEWNDKIGEYGNYLGFNSFKDYRSSTFSSRVTDDFPKYLPDSLKNAILCFVLAIAIKESRKPQMINSVLYNPHDTMLIHVSRFTLWQNKTKLLVEEYIDEVIYSIKNDSPNSTGSIYKLLEKIWYKYYALIVRDIKQYLPIGYIDEFMTPIVFESLKNHLPEAVEGLEVKAINSITGAKLEYPKNDPKKIIAIGGNRLSRGFTLEGLSINYFVRNTNYADTLLQMGRWFGYRPGYLDCCKLFTTQDSIDKYDLITKTIEELEVEFRKMERLKRSPSNFVLRVKKDPGTLKVTRPTILKNTLVTQGSYQDKLEMTTEFDVSKEKIERVWSAFKDGITPFFKNKDESRKGFVICQVSAPDVINILNQENNFDDRDRELITNFIRLCHEHNQLVNWTVAIKTTGNASKEFGKGTISSIESGLPVSVDLAIRRGPKTTSNNYFLLRDKKRFKATGSSANITSSSKDLSLTLTEHRIKEAEEAYKAEKRAFHKKNNPTCSEEELDEICRTIPERVYREKMNEEEGLLIIYLFDTYYSLNQEKGKEDPDLKEMISREHYNLDIPIIGMAIGFPPLENDPGGDYYQGDYDLMIDEEDEPQPENDDLPEDIDELTHEYN